MQKFPPLLRLLAAALCLPFGHLVHAQCANPIACENALVGNPSSEWDLATDDAGDPSIQGFATDISVNRGSTVSFKINTDASAYRIDIYRLGWYGGMGARKVASITPTASLPQTQPVCLTDPVTGLMDCGNWGVSASWTVPSNAVSGVYVAKPVRSDTRGTSHIVFIVRDDTGNSDILFQTSDLTWDAYNLYGGTSLYHGNGPGTGGGSDGRAYKASYNRPFTLRGSGRIDGVGEFASWLFTEEYPMIRWIERNGYNVSYASGVDTDRRGVAALTTHKLYMSVGHDEYWSDNERPNVEAARAAGVNLAFFSSNECFWKVRWENSIDGSNTPYRTMVCYKETHNGAKIDPSPLWTGTWRDARFAAPPNGGWPENELTGDIFMVNAPRQDPLNVSAAEGRLRFWRNTGIDKLADGVFANLPSGVLGDEWDEQLDNGSRPAGLLSLSTTFVNPVNALLKDNGSTYASGPATHHLSLYRHSSGALVFAVGTMHWMWGLDNYHDISTGAFVIPVDVRMQQATVNILADLAAQPTTLQPGLVPANASTDFSPPTSSFIGPSSITVPAWSPMTIFGTATDTGGGIPAAVELSVDGGQTWHPAVGAANWGASWTTGAPGIINVKSRATDDSAGTETPGPGLTVNVTANSTRCSLFAPDAAPTSPDILNSNPRTEVGMSFSSEYNGWITSLRFYKSPANTGTHIGNLWSNTGQLLATVTFTNETVSGWQEAPLATPVPITAGATYVISYHTDTGHFYEDANFFASTGIDRAPLHAAPSTAGNPNGFYSYGASAFPSLSYLGGSNYWVDVVYTASLSPDTTPPVPTALRPAFGSPAADPGGLISVQFNEGITASTVNSTNFTLRDPQNNLVTGTLSYDANTKTARLQPSTGLAQPGNYVATIKGGTSGIADLAGNRLVADLSWPFSAGQSTLFAPDSIPGNQDEVNNAALEMGIRFYADRDGWITAVRFFKTAANVGTHIGNLWSETGARLATVTYTSETGSGWQQAELSSPVHVTAGTHYVASYHMENGHYAEDFNYFANAGVDRGVLHAPQFTASQPNGVYVYGPSAFPTFGYASGSNYWVDIVYASSNQVPPPVITPTAGTYPAALPVTLTSIVPGAQIYYTTNGTAPTTASTRYTAPVSISNNTTVKAIAVASGWTTSAVATSSYTIQPLGVVAPTLTPAGGTYFSPQSVALSTGTPAAQIYFTTNGTTPTASSTLYLSPIAVSANMTIKAIAIAAGQTSSISSATYSFQAAPPDFTPGSGSYAPGQSVKITDGSPAAVIYYTTDGSTPTPASTKYTASFVLNATATVKAIAAVSGWATSSVSSATYTISSQSGTAPPAPSGLTATAISSAQVNLVWNDVTSETGYKIERKTGSTGSYSQIGTSATNVATYSDSTVAPSTTYFYRVRATNATSDSPYSSEVSATTPAASALPLPWIDADIGSTGIPGGASYVSGVFTVKGSGADIWNNSDAFHYVYQTISGDAELIAKVNTVQNTDAWAKAGLMVRETSAANSTHASIFVTPGNGLAFQWRATTGSASSTAAGASVTAPYWVRLVRSGNTLTGYAASDGLSWLQVGTATISMNAIVEVGLAVTAHNNASLNQSTFSNVFVTTAPAAPSALTATATSSSQINLTWTENAKNESGFKIERKTGANGTYAQITTVAANVTSFSDTGLASGTTYYYRVRSTNSAADSAYSNEANATTSASAGVPAAPTGLAATAASSTQINLAWNDVANETVYKIERKTGASGTYAQIATVGSGVTTYNNSGLSAGTAYYYRVRATNTSGDSAYSNEANATTTVATFRAAAGAGAKSGTLALAIAKPTGTQQNDVMIASIAVRPSNATISTPAGWTLLRRTDNSTGNSNSLAIYYKVAGASEGLSYTWSFNTSAGAAGTIASFVNVDPASPVDVNAGQNTTSGTTLPAPTVTTRYASDMVVTAHAFASSATFTPPSGMTEAKEAASDAAPTSTGESLEMNYAIQTAVGATGTRSATASNDADTGNAQTLALKSR